MRNVTVAAVKKTKHGAYGKAIASVVVTVADTPLWQRDAHAAALPLLQRELPGLAITTEITESAKLDAADTLDAEVSRLRAENENGGGATIADARTFGDLQVGDLIRTSNPDAFDRVADIRKAGGNVTILRRLSTIESNGALKHTNVFLGETRHNANEAVSVAVAGRWVREETTPAYVTELSPAEVLRKQPTPGFLTATPINRDAPVGRHADDAFALSDRESARLGTIGAAEADDAVFATIADAFDRIRALAREIKSRPGSSGAIVNLAEQGLEVVANATGKAGR